MLKSLKINNTLKKKHLKWNISEYYSKFNKSLLFDDRWC